MSPRVVRVLRFGPVAGLLLLAFAVRENRVLLVLTLACGVLMTVVIRSVPAAEVGKASWRMRLGVLALGVAGAGLGLLLFVFLFR